MPAHYQTQSNPLRHRLFAEADATSALAAGTWKLAHAPRGRALSLLALLGTTVILMATPGLVAAISIFDRSLLDSMRAWVQASSALAPYLDLFRWGCALAPYLDLVRWGSGLALVGMVVRAVEEP